MTVTVKNAKVYSEGKFKDANIVIEDGLVVSVGDEVKGEIIDAKGKRCVAGYIDVHTHGGWGKDCMDASPEAIDTICRYHLYTGTTSFAPTTMTASVEDINKAVDNIRKYANKYSRILGAHPPQLLIPPSMDSSFVWDNADMVKRVTLAPNLDGADEFCKEATERGIQVSMGHDDTIDDEIYACVESGATSVTHMYNCTSRPSRRVTPKKHLGLTEVGLIDERIVAEVIADDRHVPNALFKMIYKLKGAKGICLVSDSLSVSGMPKGDYYLGSGSSAQKIRIEDGVAILPDLNTYAGSVTPVGKMVANLNGIGIPLEDCIDMCTKTPAKLIGREDIGDIAVGKLGDVNILNDDLSIYATILGGVLVDRQALKRNI